MGNYCLFVRPQVEGVTSYMQVDMIDPSTTVAVTRQQNNFRALLKTLSDHAQDLQLLGTPNTLEALGHLHTFDAPIDRTIEFDAILLLDGVDLLEGLGKLFITDWNWDAKQDCHVGDAFVVGGRAIWVSDLTATELCEIDLGTHVKDEATIRNSWDRKGLNGPVFDHSYIGGVYLPVNYGFVSSGGGTAFSIFDLKLHIYIVNALREAFNSIGWTLDGDFLDTEGANSLISLFTGPTITPTAPEVVNSQINLDDFVPYLYGHNDILRITEIPIVIGTNNTSPYWDSETGCWEAAYDQFVTIDYRYTGAYTGVETSLELQIVSDIQGLIYQANIFNGFQINITNFCLQQKERICFFFVDQNNDLVEQGLLDPSLYMIDAVAGQTLTITTAIPTPGQCVNPTVASAKYFRQGLNAADMFQGFLEVVGAFPITDAAKKTVTVIPGDDFFDLTQTKKLNREFDCEGTVSEQIQAGNCRNLIVKYKPDSSDNLHQVYFETFQQELGAGLIEGDRNDPCRDEFENSFFSATYNERSAWSLGNPPGWWLHINSNISNLPEANHNVNPRIAVYYGLINNPPLPFPSLEWQFDIGGPISIETQLPYGYFWDGLGIARANGDADILNLSYQDERIYDFFATVGQPHILEGNLNRWFSVLSNILLLGRFIEIPMVMNVLEFLNFDNRRLWAIGTKGHNLGLFAIMTMEEWTEGNCKVTITAAKFEKFCEDPSCFTLAELGWEIPLTINGTDFGIVDQLVRFEPKFLDPDGIISDITDNGFTWITYVNNENVFVPRNIALQPDGSWQIPANEYGNNASQANANPFDFTYEQMVWNREFNTFTILSKEGLTCTFTICSTAIVTGEPTQQEVVFLSHSISCGTQREFDAYTLDLESCVENFIEQTIGNPITINEHMVGLQGGVPTTISADGLCTNLGGLPGVPSSTRVFSSPSIPGRAYFFQGTGVLGQGDGPQNGDTFGYYDYATATYVPVGTISGLLFANARIDDFAYNPVDGQIYIVANRAGTDYLGTIDLATGAVTATVFLALNTGGTNYSFAIDDNGVGWKISGNMQEINLATGGNIARPGAVPLQYEGMQFMPNGDLWIYGTTSSEVHFYDPVAFNGGVECDPLPEVRSITRVAPAMLGNEVLDPVRCYQIIDFQVDGRNFWPEIWPHKSDEFDQNTATYIEADAAGNVVADNTSPNNFYNFVRWFNNLWVREGANQPVGPLGNFGSPVRFRFSDDKTAIQYSTSVEWSLTIRKFVDGVGTFDYFFSWDPVNGLYYNLAAAGNPRPPASFPGYLGPC